MECEEKLFQIDMETRVVNTIYVYAHSEDEAYETAELLIDADELHIQEDAADQLKNSLFFDIEAEEVDENDLGIGTLIYSSDRVHKVHADLWKKRLEEAKQKVYEMLHREDAQNADS